MKMRYKIEDALTLRKNIEVLLKVALEEVLKHPIHLRVLSSNIQHTELQPEGDAFDIQVRVQVVEKKVEENKLPTS